MPLPVAHGLLGAVCVAALAPSPGEKRPLIRPLFAGAVLANLADFDFLLVFAFGDKLWHRGFTHSIAFAALVFLSFAVCCGANRRREAIGYGLAYASHAALDFVTTRKGDGLELFFPFSAERFGARLFALSEKPSQMTPAEIVAALLVEFAIFASALLVVLLARSYFGRPLRERR